MGLNAGQIVEKYLKDNGYDGLFCSEEPCACLISDIAPCGEPNGECEAGYKTACDGSAYCDGKCEFHICRDKPAEPKGASDGK